MADADWLLLRNGLIRLRSDRIHLITGKVFSTLREAYDTSRLESVQPELRREQAKSLATVVVFLSLGGWTCDAVTLFDFSHSLRLSEVFLVSVTAVLYALWLFYALTFHNDQQSEYFLNRSARLVTMLGAVWATLLAALAASATETQSGIVIAFLIAFISTPIVSVPLVVALLFWLPVSLSGVLSLLYLLKPFDPYLFVCYIGYLGFTLSAIVYLNRMLILRCISALQLDQQHHLVELLLHDFEEAADEWLWETDHELRLTRVSARLAEITRRQVEALRGCIIYEVVRFSATRCPDLFLLRRAFRNRHPFRNVTIQVEVEGEQKWWTLTGRPIFDENAEYQGYRGIGSDITERRLAADRISFMAEHDALTGLYNRDWFGKQVDAAGKTAAERPFVLFLIDLDRFKAVNDTMGHATGDLLLAAVSKRLVSNIRVPSKIARFGGDEFAVMAYVTHSAEIESLANRMLASLCAPYLIQNHHVEVGASLGSVGVFASGQTGPQLMQSADVALYRAKAEGRGTWRSFDLEMDASNQLQLTLKADLRKALDNLEFSIAYQPVVNLTTFEIVYFEALLRWQHPSRGSISPAVFIPMAEEMGLISEVGAWVLHHACIDAATWPDHFGIAVNVSAIQLVNADLVQVVDRAIAYSQLLPPRLSLEITESAFLKTDSIATNTLDEFRKRGIKIVLDDFGTGYSSLAYLTQFRLDRLKIDANFVSEMFRNASATLIVKSIALLGEELVIETVGEGLETVEQVECLRKLHVTNGQGFLLGRPMPARDVLSYVTSEGQPKALRQKCLKLPASPQTAAFTSLS